MLCLVLRLPRVGGGGGGGGGGGTSVRNGRLLFKGAKGRNVVLPILSLGLWVNKHTM